MTGHHGSAAALSIVIPAYNERHRIGLTLEKIRQYAHTQDEPWQIIVVDDGSSDGTAELVRQFDAGPLRLRVLVNDRNRGKGYSTRRGMLEAEGRRVMLCDADLSMPIEQCGKLLAKLDEGYDVAIASRDMPDSVLDPPQPWRRRLMGASFRALRSLLILRGLRDTQCGFKCFDHKVARRVFALQRTEGFAFDCEVLAIAERLGCTIIEVGVVWRDNRDSRVAPLSDSIKMLINLIAIRRRVKRLKLDDGSGADNGQNA